MGRQGQLHVAKHVECARGSTVPALLLLHPTDRIVNEKRWMDGQMDGCGVDNDLSTSM